MAQIPGQENKEKTTALKGEQLGNWYFLPCADEFGFVYSTLKILYFAVQTRSSKVIDKRANLCPR